MKKPLAISEIQGFLGAYRRDEVHFSDEQKVMHDVIVQAKRSLSNNEPAIAALLRGLEDRFMLLSNSGISEMAFEDYHDHVSSMVSELQKTEQSLLRSFSELYPDDALPCDVMSRIRLELSDGTVELYAGHAVRSRTLKNLLTDVEVDTPIYLPDIDVAIYDLIRPLFESNNQGFLLNNLKYGVEAPVLRNALHAINYLDFCGVQQSNFIGILTVLYEKDSDVFYTLSSDLIGLSGKSWDKAPIKLLLKHLGSGAMVDLPVSKINTEALLTSLCSNRKLRKLKLTLGGQKDRDAEIDWLQRAVAGAIKSTDVSSINLSECVLGYKELRPILLALREPNNVTELCLNYNQLLRQEVFGVNALVKRTLKDDNCRLHTLTFKEDCRIDPELAVTLEALNSSPPSKPPI